MRLLRYLPRNTSIDFVGARWVGFAFTIVTVLASIVSLFVQGLNLGIDFTGGTLIEIRKQEAIDVASLRASLERLDFGEVAIQGSGDNKDALIRVQPRGGEADERAAQRAVVQVRGALGCSNQIRPLSSLPDNASGDLRATTMRFSIVAPESVSIDRLSAAFESAGYGGVIVVQNPDNANEAYAGFTPVGEAPAADTVSDRVSAALGCSYRFTRVEAVGPKVSGELYFSGVIASVLAVLIIALYVAFRFEWQFGVSAIVATGHDVFVTVGMFSLFQLDFNLTAVAALLALAGYSINDTVVVFDRIREMRRKYKSKPLGELINLSVNQTLSRTILTSATTAIAILPLFLFGGATLLNFSAAMLFGIVIGTYSSIYVAGALLLYLPALGGADTGGQKAGARA